MWLSLITASLAAVLSAAAQAATPVTLYAGDTIAPYSYTEAGEVKGLYVEIVRAVTQRMPDYQVNIEAVPWRRGLSYVESGQGFAIFPPYHRSAMRANLWPYSLPMLAEEVVVFCRPEVVAKGLHNWPEDFSGLIIGRNAGFASGGVALEQAIEQKLIQIEEAPNAELNLLKLAGGRLDCFIDDRLATQWQWGQMKKLGTLPLSAQDSLQEVQVLSREQGFLAYTNQHLERYPFKEDFVRQFDQQLYELYRSGELQQLVDAYLR